jgi:type I restriction enzyme S subunit
LTPETFLENFSTVVSAPNGVQCIRDMVLDLAVMGRLTSSIDSDTPATDCLLRCHRHYEALVASGDIRSQTAPSEATRADYYWPIPATWVWCTIGEVTSYGYTVKAEFNDVSSSTWVLELEDIEKGTSEVMAKMRARERRFRSSKNRFSPGQVLYGKLRPYLDKVVLADEGGVCTTEIMPILAFDGLDPGYLRVFLKSPKFKSYATNSTHGMNLPRLGTQAARDARIPLPPLEEQKRIVAKVDELMRLCDRLKAQQQEREKLLPLLSRANHTRFVNGPTEANLRSIFPAERQSSASCLKATVLSLAVKGLLVTQDESDQPAEKLMKDILSATRASDDRQASRLAKKVLKVETAPFSLPRGWKWIRLGAICESIDYGTSHKADSNAGNVPVYRMGDIQEGELQNDNLKYVPPEIDDLPNLFLQPGDILFNRTNSAELVGKAAIFRGPAEKYTFASYLIRVRVPKKFVSPEYINLCFLSPYFRATQIAPELTQQCGQANFNGTKLANTLFPLPPKSEQERIVLKVKVLLGIVSRLEAMHTTVNQVASDFARASVELITGMSNSEMKQVKTPKTEVVTALKVGRKPKKPDAAPLATLLSVQKAEASAKTLWQLSGLEIDAFYLQLKTEMANGWIDEDKDKRAVQEVEAR